MQNNLPVLVLKGQILLPNCDIKVELEKEKYKNLLDISELFHNFKILVVQKENELEETNQIKNFPKIGVIAKITHKIELPNGKIRFILTGLSRAKVLEYLTNDTNIESIITKIEIKEDSEDKIYVKKLKEELKKYIDIVPYVGNSISQVVENTTSLDVLTNIVPSILSIDRNRQFEYLNEISPKIRTEMALKDIYEEEESFNIEKELDAKVRKTLDESQREYILKEKLKEIKQELNEKSVKEDETEEDEEDEDELEEVKVVKKAPAKKAPAKKTTTTSKSTTRTTSKSGNKTGTAKKSTGAKSTTTAKKASTTSKSDSKTTAKKRTSKPKTVSTKSAKEEE